MLTWVRFLQYPACNKGKYRQKSQVLIFIIKKIELSVFPTPKLSSECSLAAFGEVDTLGWVW